ncbi:MAG: glycosyltransferase [Actinomycetota bacterium]
MARLLILTAAELTRDPRARRAATAAVAAGLDVVGVCQASGGAPVGLPGVAIVRTNGGSLSTRLRSAGLGGGRRDHAILREARGVFRLLRLARLTVALTRGARRTGAVEIVHANDFDTLLAGWLIAGRRGRLVYDAHEIYTEQEVDPPRFQRAVVAGLERMLVRRAADVVTVNEPIAAELTRRLRLPHPAPVVGNVPETVHIDEVERSAQLRVVYQGALGHGRQLDDLVRAAELTGEEIRFSLRVVGQPTDELRRFVAGRADVLEPVDPDMLVAALAPFDVGVVVTRPLTLNDELATPNKLFEYLMAGLAVAAPRLPGVASIIERDGVGVTFSPGDPADLARALRDLAADRTRLEEIRRRARQVAVEKYNASAERPALAAAWGIA